MACHPQTNGQAELANREIKNILEKTVNPTPCHLPVELEHNAYWAIKKLNFSMPLAGAHRKLQLTELEEMRYDAYDHSGAYKSKIKASHDKKTVIKNFEPGQKVSLYNSHLHLHPDKLHSRWAGPYVVKTIFPHGAIEVESMSNSSSFKVNGQRLKPFLGSFEIGEPDEDLVNPVYTDDPVE
ncbi:uncharacterized protein LOC131306768 [Rhododendron vialii]|uniref:uncharacterized protein LOC131306768 n=1 Tax=Rhododendron vialii TaxID=182163 RepID=UPI00265DCAC3|nr:uncharacterized protein LOC131306768 [Rhododendron vialii]